MRAQDDFNNQLWNVVMLAMGGSALGEAVKSSGLLEAIATGIQDVIVGYGTWGVLAIFCALVLVATTFISHTVGAMVILPIVQAVGADMSVSPALQAHPWREERCIVIDARWQGPKQKHDLQDS